VPSYAQIPPAPEPASRNAAPVDPAIRTTHSDQRTAAIFFAICRSPVGKPTILAIDLSGAILSRSSFVVEHHDDRVVIAIHDTSDHAKMQFPFQH
jgi:hypothetical protein